VGPDHGDQPDDHGHPEVAAAPPEGPRGAVVEAFVQGGRGHQLSVGEGFAPDTGRGGQERVRPGE
jgi:hypothetical protein